MTINPKNSTIDGWDYTENGWEPYDFTAATIVSNYLRVPHRTDGTFHRVRCRKRGHKPELRDGVWYWVKVKA